MYSDSDTRPALAGVDISAGWNDRIGSAVLHRVLSNLATGRIVVDLPGGGRIERNGATPGPEARLSLRRWSAVRRLVTGGDIGFAEGYMAGDWSSPDLAALVALVAANGAVIEAKIAGLAPLRLINRLYHFARRNSRAGSRRNIAFHYDLGNAFYRLWLDPSMTYSSALYARPDADDEETLEQAQAAKLARITHLLQLAGGEHVLEIGSGWGALAARLAASGARVTGLTLSHEQLAHARTLMEEIGHEEAVELRLQDYRDVEGQYDRIVSIEMLEAVGVAYWPVYFQTLRERLVAGGTAVLQVITIADERFEGYRTQPDFIQRYIFPGGMLPTKSIVAEEAARAGLSLEQREDFGTSYARTLAEWRRRFLAAGPELERLGFDPRFRRLWDYYLAYCEGGFRAGAIDVSLFVLRRPESAAAAT
ncbi:class I SAM-dependent methyltransferase [Ancylobacter sp. VNQ12]|uniref:class I SAM-dependent methyltransferase n=1 Tax=Ancylobacter sp. VNQ12 TaxID=3400920 RepID=UPI003C05D1AF